MERFLGPGEPEVFKPRYYGVLPEVLPEPSLEESRQLEEQFTYEHLSKEDQDMLDRLMKGKLPLDELPSAPLHTVRIYMDAPFVDTIQERNELIKNVYPKLKTYCRDKHAMEFQVVDMRWGVPKPPYNDDHKDIDTGVRELHHCQTHSVGPDFVFIIGQKYGPVLLPATITATDFDTLREALKNNGDDVALLEHWYWLDYNAMPNIYILQPVSEILGKETGRWPETERKMRTLLIKGLKLCVNNQHHLSKKIMLQIQTSVTEQEASWGAFGRETSDAQKRSFCLDRNITDLKENRDKKRAYRYLDMHHGTTLVDEGAADMTRKMKTQKIPESIKNENICKFDVRWSEPHGVDPKDHSTYLLKMGNAFYEKCTRLIDRNANEQQELNSYHLYKEVLCHLNIAKERSNTFCGREDDLIAIRDYLLEETDQPMVVHAPSGFGKTSLLCQAANHINRIIDIYEKEVHATVILRVIGSTFASSSIHQLLKSLCHQIAYATGAPRHKVPEDFKSLKRYFFKFIQNGDFPGLVVLLLDGLDQITIDEYEAHKLDWLPVHLPGNVKMILSTTPADNDILKRLQFMIPIQQNYLELKTMTPHLCNIIVETWLKQAKRRVSPTQLKIYNDAFRKCTTPRKIYNENIRACTTPLYVKMVFEEVVRWKHSTVVDGCTIPETIDGMMNKFLETLEDKHGKMLVSRTLSYITAARFGLSEAEVDDIFSLDDELLNVLYKQWEPPIRRFPTVLWVKLKHDLDGYLVERESGSVNLLTWHHRQLGKAVEQRYLSDPEVEEKVHSVIADYFLGKWSWKWKKPYTQNNSSKSAVRYVSEQPIIYEEMTMKPHFNYRKLNQLPYHLAKSRRFADLNKEVFFNYDWIHAKLRGISFNHLIEDFNLSTDKDVRLVRDALRMSEYALTVKPDSLGPELVGRLIAHNRKYPNIRNLIYSCDLTAMKRCPLVPKTQLYTAPGGPLEYMCDIHPKINPLDDIQFIETNDVILMVSKQHSRHRMYIWNINQGNPRPKMNLPIGNVYPTPDGKFLQMFKQNKILQTYKVETGELYGEVNFGKVTLGCVSVSKKYVAFTVKQKGSPYVIDYEARAFIHQFDSQSQIVAISPDQEFIVFNSGHNVLALHQFPLMERKCTIPIDDVPIKIMFTKDTTHFLVQYRGQMLRSYKVDLIHHNHFKETNVLHGLEMQDFKLSHTEKYILVRGSSCIFLISTPTKKMLHRLYEVPNGVYLETLSTYQDAFFTPEDKMVAAIRHTFLCLWDSVTGSPVRLFQASINPICKLFTSSFINKAVTIAVDNTLQLWDLDNIDSDVLYSNEIFGSGVAQMFLSHLHSNSRLVCRTLVNAEAKIVDIDSGKCIRTIEHSPDPVRRVLEVIISPDGNYIITRADNPDAYEVGPENCWQYLREDKLWEVSTGQMIYHTKNSRNAFFSSDSKAIAIITCDRYNKDDFEDKFYSVALYEINTKELQFFELGKSEIVGNPFITIRSGRLVYMTQRVSRETCAITEEILTFYEVKMVLHMLSKFHFIQKYLRIQDIWKGADKNFSLLDVRQMLDDNVFVVYRKGRPAFPYNENSILLRDEKIPKGAVIYNLFNEQLLKRFDNFASPGSNIENMVHSKYFKIVLDEDLQVFDVHKGKQIHKLQAKLARNSAKLMMDGKYTAAFTETKRDVVIYRAEDGVKTASSFLHGVGTCLEVGTDDRTIFIATEDGRILSYLLILNSIDPVREHIQDIASRKMHQPSLPSLISSDIQLASTKMYELRRMSVALHEDFTEQYKRPPTYRTLETAVMVTTRNSAYRSQSCCIQ